MARTNKSFSNSLAEKPKELEVKRSKVNSLGNEFKKFLETTKKNPDPFALGNNMLYNMCKEHPSHKDIGDIISKVWLIGRSYAAAIERTSSNKNGDIKKDGEDFYVEKVGPRFSEKAKVINLDDRLKELNDSPGDFIENANMVQVLVLHKDMVDLLKEISGMEKRSLASKYLHFHCKKKVLIYDSRASKAVNAIVRLYKIKSKKSGESTGRIDKTYACFVCKVIAIVEEITRQTGLQPDPRTFDNFLLHHIFPKYCVN